MVMTELKLLASGIAMGESPRWHDGRLWFSDRGAQEIIAVDMDGNKEAAHKVDFPLPFCIDWSKDGRLLIVSGRPHTDVIGCRNTAAQFTFRVHSLPE